MKKNKNILKTHYSDIFLNITDYKDFIKKDVRTYATYDDYKDIYYISPLYFTKKLKFRFYIKKHWFNNRLEVRIYPNIELNSYSDRIIIFKDILHIKRKHKINNKIDTIKNQYEYYNLLSKLSDDNYIRSKKIKYLKNKL